MQWRYTLSDVRLEEAAIEAGLEALRSNWLTMGPRTQALEEAWAERFGAAHGVAVSSGSAGLHLACRVVGVGPGDEVVVPAMSFVADAHAPHWCGGEAVFADIGSLHAPQIDLAAVERCLGERTKAVLAVHMFGYPLELDGLTELCAERGIALIEDCCEASGARLADGSPVGTRGAVAVHSFFSKSGTPVGEGGIVLTDDPEMAEQVRLWRSHAMTSVTWDRHRGHAETYDVVDLGFNYRIDEPRAAIAAAQIEGLDDRLRRVRAAVADYRERLEVVAGVEVPFEPDAGERSAHYSMPVLLPAGTGRDRVREALTERAIQTSFYPALTQLAIFAGAAACPLAEEFADRHLTLPLSPYLDSSAVAEICGELEAALAAT